jgi:prevent-host-death family protein
MVINGHHLVMKEVGIAELKARLSAHLRSVRRGHPITVVDRGTPVARLVPVDPVESLRARHPVRRLQEVRLPPPLGRSLGALEALLDERSDR